MAGDEPNNKSSSSKEKAATQSESAVYDRQIRLWGADAQARMSQVKILYIHMTGASSEIVKNMVLAGIRPAICDTRKVTEHKDFLRTTPSFFWQPGTMEASLAGDQSNDNENNSNNNKRAKTFHTIAELVQPKIEELNPLLGECELVQCSVSDLTSDILKDFSVVVASRMTPQQALELAGKLTADQKLFWVDSMGMYGCCLVDLGQNHMFRAEKGKDTLLEPKPVEPYIPLAELWKQPLHEGIAKRHKKGPPSPLLWHRTFMAYCEHKQAWPEAHPMKPQDIDDFCHYIRNEWLPATSPQFVDGHELLSEASLRTFAAQATSEIIPVCSVIGGMCGNELIKAITGKGSPANNTILFDGTTCQGWYFLFPVPPNKK